MEHQQAAAHHEEHPPTTIRQYILIGVILAIITVVELALTEAFDLETRTLVILLVALSSVKFAIVVALFMHLRFDNPLFWRLFAFGLVLAGSILVALLALFWGDHQESRTVAAYATPGAVAAHAAAGDDDHGDEGTPAAGGEATPGEGGAPAGDPAAAVVQDMPVGEFFQANCAACHGADRQGVVGPALTPERLTEPDEFYHDTIANGRTGTAMPPWSPQLSDEDINALVQFIKHVEP